MEIALNKECISFLIEHVNEFKLRDGDYFKHALERKLDLLGASGSATLSLPRFNVDLLEKLAAYLSENKSDEPTLFILNGYINTIKNPLGLNPIKSVKLVIPNFVKYILKDAINGWLFQREPDGVVLPWFVKDMKYFPRYKDSPPSVSIELQANDGRSIISKTIRLGFQHIYNLTIEQILLNESLVKETAELIKEYESQVDIYKQYINMHGAQFVTHEIVMNGDIGTKDVLRTIKPSDRFVNDEGRAKKVITEEMNHSFWHGMLNSELIQAMISDGVDVATLEMVAKIKMQANFTPFNKLPIHLKIRLFNLNEHYYSSMHVSKIKPYVYMDQMQSKLVLPSDHHDLIQMLTQEVSDFNADVIAGKNTGSNILCLGKPGLGKTLTAEVYSEVCKKPLYRVHSGQLGASAKDIESNLENIMTRASSWDAILLIDEADVFIRARDNDAHHNSIVSVFLRKMEYFSGLLFMTSNREDDIDDAILSRCVAIIKYKKPNEDELRNIWTVQNEQMQTGMSPELIEQLSKKFNSLSGRDVNRLLSLTKRYAHNKKIALDFECFRKCAVFRGIA